jgi:hypothetical protein
MGCVVGHTYADVRSWQKVDLVLKSRYMEFTELPGFCFCLGSRHMSMVTFCILLVF